MILTPNDIISKEIEKNKNVSKFLSQIETFLNSLTEFEQQYSIDIETDFPLSNRDFNLVKISLNKSGWGVNINYCHNNNTHNIRYTVFLYSIDKFYI